jgi:hypothetical protein
MKKYLFQNQIEFNKSLYFIDLVQHETNTPYIRLMQRMGEESKEVNIPASVLTEIIEILVEYRNWLMNNPPVSALHFSEADKEQIKARYLKGLSTKELALQFDKNEKLIKMVLINLGLELVSQEMPKSNRYRKRKKKNQ